MLVVMLAGNCSDGDCILGGVTHRDFHTGIAFLCGVYSPDYNKTGYC